MCLTFLIFNWLSLSLWCYDVRLLKERQEGQMVCCMALDCSFGVRTEVTNTQNIVKKG